METASRRRIARLAAIAAVTAASTAGVLGVASQPACSPAPCDYNPKEASKAVPSIQCPSGDVCYQGACRKACEPGRETSMACNSNGDCKDSSLPFCVSSTVLNGSFCSSCDSTETCIPEIGICQGVVEIPTPEQPTPSGPQNIPLPLDGGAIDGNIFSHDAAEPPPPEKVTHFGSIEIRQVTDFTGPTERNYPLFDVGFFDVRTGTVVQVSSTIDQLGQCEIEQPTVYSQGAPADVGAVRIEAFADTPDALASDLNAMWSSMLGRYQTAPVNLPDPTLTFSTLPMSRFITVFSPGLMDVTQPWPTEPFNYHVPFALELDNPTTVLISTPITITDPAQDLSVKWVGIPASVGVVGGEKVSLQILGGGLRLRCQEIEGFLQSRDTIDVPGSLLDEYRAMEMPAMGEERTLVLERVFEQTLPIDGAPDSRIVVDATLDISSTFVATLRF